VRSADGNEWYHNGVANVPESRSGRRFELLAGNLVVSEDRRVTSRRFDDLGPATEFGERASDQQ